MSEPKNVPILEYRHEERSSVPKRRRTFYCIGLPLVAFGMAGGFYRAENGLVAAIGAFLIALALPVRE